MEQIDSERRNPGRAKFDAEAIQLMLELENIQHIGAHRQRYILEHLTDLLDKVSLDVRDVLQSRIVKYGLAKLK